MAEVNGAMFHLVDFSEEIPKKYFEYYTIPSDTSNTYGIKKRPKEETIHIPTLSVTAAENDASATLLVPTFNVKDLDLIRTVVTRDWLDTELCKLYEAAMHPDLQK
jgi:hypothetical protein